MPLIDTNTALPGTVGFLPPGTCFEFDNADDLKDFADPSTAFVLGEDRKWRNAHDLSECVFDPRSTVNMYDDWREAVYHRVNSEIADAREEIAEAQKVIDKANTVCQMVLGYKG